MRTPLARLSLIFTVAATITLSSVSSAQTDGYHTASNKRGELPSGSYQFSNIDSIDVATGALNLNIPLYARPGRGLDSRGLFVYSSKIWMVRPIYDPNRPGVVVGAYWLNTREPVIGIMSTGPGGLNYTEDIVQCDCAGVDPPPPNPFVTIRQHFAYTTDDFKTVHFPNRRLIYPPGLGSNLCTNINTDTLDQGTSEEGGLLLDSSNDPTYIVRYPNGRQDILNDSNWSLSVAKDANGNLMSGSSDTLGRTQLRASDGTAISYQLSGDPGTYSYSPGFRTSTPQGPMYIGGGGTPQPSTLTLPNGRTFHFEYDPGGEISKVILPTGGYIRYDYTVVYGYDWGPDDWGPVDSRRVSHRYVNSTSTDGTTDYSHESTWSYSYSFDSNGLPVTQVQDPSGNVTVHTFGAGNHEITTVFNQGQSTPLMRLDRVWDGDSGLSGWDQYGFQTFETKNWRVKQETTTLLDVSPNRVRQVQTDYDKDYGRYYAYPCASVCHESRMNVMEVREYDYGSGSPGPLMRRTDFDYKHYTDSNYDARHIWDRVTSKRVYNGAGTQVAYTLSDYDTTTPTQQSGVVQHDYTNFPAGMRYRGNLTDVWAWRNTDGAMLHTVNAYDEVGNLASTTDPGGHSASFSYVDNFYNYTPPQPTAAYVTQVTMPQTSGVNHITRTQYYLNTGLTAATCGQNFPASSQCSWSTSPASDLTTYAYDVIDRLTATMAADGGMLTYNHNGDVVPMRVTKTQTATPNPSIVANTTYDGLGRVVRTQLLDPEGDDFVDTAYDANGRVYSASNPYRTSSDPTYGITYYSYDALARVTAVKKQDDNGTGNNTVLTSYSGNCATVTDEALRQRKSCSDALGRLSGVWEDPATLNYETDYQYNALGDLLRVDQKGDSPGNSANWRTRTFTYDSLSRLTGANNPESGTINYSYDADGNLMSKTDARSVVVSFAYDALHRVVHKYLSSGSIPQYDYQYDESQPSPRYGVGRLTFISDRTSIAQAFYYDTMGRVTAQAYCLPSDCSYNLKTYAAYDLAGQLTSLTYPSGRKVTSQYSNAGRLKNVTFDSFNGRPVSAYSYWTADPSQPNPWGSFNYWPTGAPHIAQLGNGVYNADDYNPRLEKSRWFVYRSGTMLAERIIGYDENGHNNGNVRLVTDNLNGANNQSYGYDQLNRVTSASSSSWSQTFTIDPWSNLKQFGTWNFVQNYNGNNRLSGYSYDAAGNLLSDTFHGYSYDGESRIKQVDAGASATYTYGADGQRVRKDTPVGWTEYLTFGGNIIGEKNSNGSWSDYIFANGNRVARVDVGSIIVRFTNDSCSGCGGTPVGGGDRNLYVNSITIGSNTIYPNDPSISYTAAPCNSTQGNLGVILCNGDMIASTDAEGQAVTVNAWGLPDYNVYPHMQVWVNGMLLGEWDVTGTAQNYTASNLIDVRFTNDSCSGCGGNPVGGGDRNLYVNSITIGSTTVNPNSSSVWYTAAPCNSTQGNLGVILCNGDMLASTLGSGQSVTVNAWGMSDYYVYPHMELWLNGMMIGQWDVTGSAQNYTTTIANRGVHYYHADHLGTARLETDSTGAVVSNCTYAPFGQELGCSPSDQTNHYKFTGKERDSESGLDYFGARYYGSTMGRWLSPDWSANPEPVPYAKLDNPQSLNLYGYVLNNPVTNRDPDGHICIFGIGSTCGGKTPPPPPPPPQVVPLNGANPLTGQPGLATNPKGVAGNIRPGVPGTGQGYFGARRDGGRQHKGFDISGRSHFSMVMSWKAGTVANVGNDTKGYGTYVDVSHGDGEMSRYAHLSAVGVEEGDRVSQGEILGVVGQTGNARTNPESEAHLHFEIRVNGVAVDPRATMNQAKPPED